MRLDQISKPRSLTARRIALLTTTIVGLSAAALFVAPSLPFHSGVAFAQNLSQEAKKVTAPVGFADIVEKVKPAVISVRVKADLSGQVSTNEDTPFPKGSPMERFFRQFGFPNQVPGAPRGRRFAASQGSGFFISADGYAVTNNHVVEHATQVEVVTDDGKIHPAKVIGTDPRTDLALIKVEGDQFPFVKLADKPPRIGDWVLAVGNPFGLGGTVTAGIVSARGRDIGAGPYDDFLQIDAPVNKGNSGGPTFNTDGEVIGVNTAIFSPSGGSVGIAFAIPSDTVKTVVAQLKDKGSVVRGWIGVQIQPVTPEIADSLGLKNAKGALVAEPQKDSPAVKAGIEAGDVIVSVDGQPVPGARELARKIASLPPGTSVKLGLIRKGTEKIVTLTLGELPSQQSARLDHHDQQPPGLDRHDQPPPRADRDLRRENPSRPGSQGNADSEERHTNNDQPRDRTADTTMRLGLSLAPAGNEPGVVVAEIDPASPAADYGVKVGDVILEVGGQTVATPADVGKALGKARDEGKHSVLFRVKTEQGTRFLAIPLGHA
jgi:serine protease Do